MREPIYESEMVLLFYQIKEYNEANKNKNYSVSAD